MLTELPTTETVVVNLGGANHHQKRTLSVTDAFVSGSSQARQSGFPRSVLILH